MLELKKLIILSIPKLACFILLRRQLKMKLFLSFMIIIKVFVRLEPADQTLMMAIAKKITTKITASTAS